MKRWPGSPTISAISTLTAAVLGCTSSSTKVPAGAPVMVAFSVATPAGEVAELATEAGAPNPVPALSYFFALFDRILDPTALETLDSDGGLAAKTGVATVEWAGGNIAVNTLYIPNGHHVHTLLPALAHLPFGRGPSVTISPLRDPENSIPGMPSGATIKVTLNPNMVRSHDQTTPFVAGPGVMSPLIVQTAALAATIVLPKPPPLDAGDDAGTDDGGADGGAPPRPVSVDAVAVVTFNNLTVDATAQAIQASATVAGIPVVGLVAMVVRDAMDPVSWTVSPPPGGWPAGSVVTVTVGPEVADNYGILLGTAATASFMVAP